MEAKNLFLMRWRYLSYGANLERLFRKISAYLIIKGYKVQSDHTSMTLVAVKERALTVIKMSFGLHISGTPDDFIVEMDRDVSRMVKDTTLAGVAAWVLAPFTLGISVLGTAAGGEVVYKQAESDLNRFISEELKKSAKKY